MNCIYKIYLNEDVYVGSTTTNFNRRMIQHKCSCNNPNLKDYNYPIYQFIRDNGGWDNFNKEVIFETDKTGKELLELERYYIETLKSNLNSQIPSRTDKEYNKYYYEKNKEKRKEYQKKYEKNNKDKIKEKIKCEICNSIVIKRHLLRHQRTKKCLSCK